MPHDFMLAEDQALKLLAYLTASADISLFEPDIYGPFRLIDAAGQLAGYVLEHNSIQADQRTFWQGIKTEIKQKRAQLRRDRPGFERFLAGLPGKVAAELARHEATPDPGAAELLRFLAYLTASADISSFEPELYPPFRLIDAASQLAGYVLTHDIAPDERRPFWEATKTEIDQKKVWLMWDRPGFREFLAGLPAKVARELRQRYH